MESDLNSVFITQFVLHLQLLGWAELSRGLNVSVREEGFLRPVGVVL